MSHEIDNAIRRHFAERRPDHCDWSKRRLRDSEVTYTGTDKKGRWRTVAAEHMGVLVEIHAVGVYNPPPGVIDHMPRPQLVSEGPVISDYSPAPWKDDDRRWFEAHPRRTHRRRPLYPDELPIDRLPEGTAAMVIVRQLQPGIRTKALCAPPIDAPPPDHDEGLSILFDMIVEREPRGLTAISGHEVAAELARRHPGGTA